VVKTRRAWVSVVSAFFLALAWSADAAVTLTVTGQTPGPTPFISNVQLVVSDPNALKSIQFEVASKPGSVVRPIRATYSRDYLQARGYLDLQTGEVTLPVFGLYADFANSVAVTAALSGNGKRRTTVAISTPAFDDPTGVYTNPTVVLARSSAQKLSYDYILLKGYIGGLSPVIIDTDGEVRWVGTADASSLPAILFENGIYVARNTSITRMELDGTFRDVNDFASSGVTDFHHNFDPGKRGILTEVDTAAAQESVVIEIDADGQPLQTWDMNEILRSAMLAGGDDPNALVKDGVDWFHNNANTYQKSTNSLIVSSRENFVIAVDYDTGEIRWILGDPTKNWYQFASLRKFALTLGADTLPPIGQHAVSIAKGGDLLLFDDGANSMNQTPAGDNRDYSAARKYKISAKKMLAQEKWTYVADPSIYSPFCSSIYEDRRKNYLLDYSLAGFVTTDIVGLTPKGDVAFHYSYPIMQGCGVGWNALPVHLEKISFK
jgi:arylsulfate sulfotransferase